MATTDPVLPSVVQAAFFSGQRLTPADLTVGQDYHREMRWLHNRSMHQWGIALGLLATGNRGDKEVAVKPGYALDHLGRDLALIEGTTLAVPPVAGDASGNPVQYYLTISYVEDKEARVVESRKGACAGEGAVREADRPQVRWQRVFGGGGKKGSSAASSTYRAGLDIVLASAFVKNCMLEAPLSLAERRDARPSTQPYVAGGATAETKTPWGPFRKRDDEGKPIEPILGVETTVDTSSGRFKSTPTYLAQVHGERQFSVPSKLFYEGWVSIADPTADKFTLQLFMPEHAMSSGWRMNPKESFASDATVETLAKALSEQMRWHVVWTGVEG